MSVFEGRVWIELRKLRESEATLQAMFETLRGAGVEKVTSFMASLRTLDERARRLENLLERAS